MSHRLEKLGYKKKRTYNVGSGKWWDERAKLGSDKNRLEKEGNFVKVIKEGRGKNQPKTLWYKPRKSGRETFNERYKPKSKRKPDDLGFKSRDLDEKKKTKKGKIRRKPPRKDVKYKAGTYYYK